MKFIYYPIRLLFVGLYRMWLGLKQRLFRHSEAYIELEVRGIVPRSEPFGMFGTGRMSLFDYRQILKRAKKDPNIEGLILRIQSLGGAGLGTIEEFRELLREFGHAGHFTAAYLEEADTRAYYLATACKRIFMVPSGTLGPLGLHMQQPFFRNTLEKLGIEPELQHIGEYKTASDMFTREDASEAHREMLDWLLSGLYDEIIRDIHVRRGLSEEEVREGFDEGLLNGQHAKELGFVDDLFYEQDLEEWIREQTDDRYHPVDDMAYRWRRIPRDVSWVPPRRVALLYACGSIHSGEGQFFPNPTVGSRSVVKSLRQVRTSPAIEGVLLRINSGGGSATASDVIAREIQRVRDEEDLPVVASMSDVAASGGYYISVFSEPIIANRVSITGSIGVVLGKFNTEELQEKSGVNTEHFKRGERAGMLSPLRRLRDDEEEKLGDMMEHVYDQFLEVVKEGRGGEKDEWEEVAEGRVWTGKQAVARNLVDRTGSFDDAIQQVRSRMNASSDAPIHIVPMPAWKMDLFGSMGAGLLNILQTVSRWFPSLFSSLRSLFGSGYR